VYKRDRNRNIHIHMHNQDIQVINPQAAF